MAEEENFSRGGGFFELGGFVGKNLAGRAVFLRGLKGISILELCRMKRKGDDRLAAEGWIMGKRQKGHFVVAGEGIWRSQENGDVVF